MWKKFISEKNIFRENVFHENCFWMVLLSMGVQRGGDRIEKLFLGPLFFNRESLTKRSNFRKVWYKYSTGYSAMTKKTKFKKSSFSETLFHEKLFERQSYKWGYRKPMIQRKIYNLEKKFSSLKLVFAKKIDWFCMIHQWVYIRIEIKKYILEKIVFFVS